MSRNSIVEGAVAPTAGKTRVVERVEITVSLDRGHHESLP